MKEFNQIKFNGYAYNTASLLKELTGTVVYTKLKTIVENFGHEACATPEQVNAALYWASINFNCKV